MGNRTIEGKLNDLGDRAVSPMQGVDSKDRTNRYFKNLEALILVQL